MQFIGSLIRKRLPLLLACRVTVVWRFGVPRLLGRGVQQPTPLYPVGDEKHLTVLLRHAGNQLPLAADPARQLDVLGHNRHALCVAAIIKHAWSVHHLCEGFAATSGEHRVGRDVHSAKVGVLEEGGEVGLRTLLKRRDGMGLEAKVGFEVLGNLAHCGRAAG